jgi:archaellum component FlaC
VCPVVIFSENGNFPTIGEFTQIADLAKRHYNLQSELDEILRSQTFSILTIQADNPSDVEIKLSTDNAIAYQKDVERPQFIAPPSAPAEMYQTKIRDIETQIDKIAYDISTNQSPESGIALDIKFQGLNASLSNFAIRLNDLENRAFDIVCRYFNIQNDVTITYSKTFSIIDTQKEIAVLEEMKNLINSPTYFKLKAMQIISNDLNTIDPADFAVIAEEVEDSFKEV